MLAVLRRNPVALGLAILLHIALAVFLALEIEWRDEVKPIGADVMVVQATLVDAQELEAAARQKEDEQRKQAAARRAEEERRLAEIEEKRKQEEARRQAEERKRIEAEKVRLAEEKRRQEEKKKAEEVRRKAELEEQRRLEEERRKQAKAKKEAEEKARKEAEEKARKEAEEKARREAEARKKAEAERKRKLEEERRRKARAKAEADRKAREAELAAQIAAEQDATELQRVSALIQEKIERNWTTRPPGTEGLKCTLRVRLGASGSVLYVSVVKSSGNVAFDRSVEAAVRKADPLPMPRSERLLAQFRELNFEFVPSN